LNRGCAQINTDFSKATASVVSFHARKPTTWAIFFMRKKQLFAA